MSSIKKRNLGLTIGGGLLIFTVATYLYTKFYNQQPSKSSSSSTIKSKYSTKSISIVITDSILSSSLPLIEILTQLQDITFILTPNITITDLDQSLNSSSSSLTQFKHKIIEFENYQSLWSILKHLNNDLIFIVIDDLPEIIPIEFKNFIRGEILELEQNSDEINETILSHLII
ncbi:hypothetical protein WICMUC_004574 [Wickerhamomyces mucosus]|uniref:Peroxisome assembly protein 22 n=1 Tax=Wickerhamomyces mucosus TaxID=1378264 RepID=A0A9P8T9W2_9ASCO|nr:hypothetical protein WICMUC_004574 [Wickerhamomyces mucosus]